MVDFGPIVVERAEIAQGWDLTGGAASVSTGSINVTSIYGTVLALRDVPVSVLAVQETKLCVGDTQVLDELRTRWEVHLPPLPAGDGDRRTRSGGVMLLTERQWQVEPLTMVGLKAEAHNVLLFALHHKPSGYRCHGAVYYGRPSRHSDTLEDLHAIAAFLVQHSSGNVLSLTDHNLDSTARAPDVLADCALDLPRWLATCQGVITLAQCCGVQWWADIPTHKLLVASLTLAHLPAWWQRTDRSIVANSSCTKVAVKEALARVPVHTLLACTSFLEWTATWKRCLVAAAGLSQEDWKDKPGRFASSRRRSALSRWGNMAVPSGSGHLPAW
eukprot:5739753-Amphidinium_carterae.2